jgi:hypothetical protein
MLTGLFLAFAAYLLTRYRQGARRALWPLPPLMALWVNLHGGYIIGLALIGLTLLGALLEAFRRFPLRAPTRYRGYPAALRASLGPLRPLLLVTVLATAATLLSPHGFEALTYPFTTYAGTANASQRYVYEWQSPDFHQPLLLVFAASLLFAVALGVTGRPLDPTALLWMLGFAFLALQSMRNIALYAIIATPLLAARLSAEIPAFARSVAAWRRPALLALGWPPVLLIVLAVLLLPDKRKDLQLGRAPNAAGYPTGAVALLRSPDLRGNLFNEYHWGGYLIYEHYPDRPVFIDGRIDVYGDTLAERYLEAAQVRPGWRQVLDQYDIRLALVARDGPLAVALAAEPGWRSLYRGEAEQLFIRDRP